MDIKDLDFNCRTIGHYISILYRLGSSYYSKEFSKFNIGSGQFAFLAYLFKNNGVNQECISNDLIMDKGTTARALKKLEAEGYIKREVDSEDKRAYRVFITKKALAIKEDFFEILRQWNKIIACDFTDEEREMALKLFRRMVSNQNKVLRREM